MTGIPGRVRDTRIPTHPADVNALIERLTAIQRFLRAADGHVPDDRLAAADTMMERAGDRLTLSRDHTVVALAGTTGSGKSSLFNALARIYLSPVGARRPTTGEAYALVWGTPGEARPLLDWLGVLPQHRMARESALDGDDEAALHGLVLLDLPDFDSVDQVHRTQVDRLLSLVDLVIWVMDPQKYADATLHDSYLRQCRQRRDVTVVVLNHADRLSPENVQRCLADLRRLLDEDGLTGVPTLATSARQPEALVDLHALLEGTVASRQAVWHRLMADVDTVTAELAELAGRPVAEDAIDKAVQTLIDSLASAAGVPALADATERSYLDRAAAIVGWPPARWLRHRPWRRLMRQEWPPPTAPTAPATTTATAATTTTATHGAMITPQEAAQTSAAGLAARGFAEQAAHQLPEAWSTSVGEAARSRVAELPDALDRAMHTTGPNLLGNPPWWRVVQAAQWLAVLVSLSGLLFLVTGAVLRGLGLPALDQPTSDIVVLPAVALLAGLLIGLALDIALRPLVRIGARRAAARASRQLRFAVAEVAREYVVAPVRTVLGRYAEASEALAIAQGTARH